jgi:hypothetical protein
MPTPFFSGRLFGGLMPNSVINLPPAAVLPDGSPPYERYINKVDKSFAKAA